MNYNHPPSETENFFTRGKSPIYTPPPISLKILWLLLPFSIFVPIPVILWARFNWSPLSGVIKSFVNLFPPLISFYVDLMVLIILCLPPSLTVVYFMSWAYLFRKSTRESYCPTCGYAIEASVEKGRKCPECGSVPLTF